MTFLEQWNVQAHGVLHNQVQCIVVAQFFSKLAAVEQLDNQPMSPQTSVEWLALQHYFESIKSVNNRLMKNIRYLISDIKVLRRLFQRSNAPFRPVFMSTVPIYNMLGYFSGGHNRRASSRPIVAQSTVLAQGGVVLGQSGFGDITFEVFALAGLPDRLFTPTDNVVLLPLPPAPAQFLVVGTFLRNTYPVLHVMTAQEVAEILSWILSCQPNLCISNAIIGQNVQEINSVLNILPF